MSIHFNALIPGVNTDFCQLRFLSNSEPVSRNFLIIFAIALFYWRLPSKFFKDTLSTVGVRHRF